jgi:protein-tyrosine phosphatase
MSLITPYLFLGDNEDAQNNQLLFSKNVKLIVNCAKELPNHFPNQFEYINLKWDDTPTQNIQKDLEPVSDKIIEHMKKGNVVFIHCFAGISRSTSVVIYTIMKLHHWNYEKSLFFVKELHPRTSPNPGFVQQLVKFVEGTRVMDEEEQDKRWSKLTFDSKKDDLPSYVKTGKSGIYARIF